MEPQDQLYRGPHEDPPSYSTIAPYAPPDVYPPARHFPSVDTMLVKGVPPGLEYLLQLNQLAVREKFSVSQGWGRCFDVLDHAGQRLFQAKQQYQCCGPIYDLKMTDNSEKEVLQLFQECACTCTRQIQVYSFGGNLIGNVKLHLNSFVTHLSVMDPSNQVVLHIIGPSFQTNIFGNSSFEVKSRDEQHVVGMIKNENEQFFVSFPMDLEVTVKALLLGGCFFLESFIYSRRRELATRRNSN